MVSSRIIGCIVTATLALANLSAYADATLVVQGSDGLKSTIQVRNGKGKMSAAGMDEFIVYDTGAGTISYVEPRLQRYTQVSEDTLEDNVQTVASIQKLAAPYMTSMLNSLSPEQRSMVMQRMGAVMGPPAAGHAAEGNIKTIARGSHTISGLRCKASAIVKNGRPAAEVCMATAASGKLSRQDFATLEAMMAFTRRMAPVAGNLLGDLAGQFDFLATGIDGVPIAVRDLELGKRYQVTAVSNAALSDDLFYGYGQFEKRAMPGLLR